MSDIEEELGLAPKIEAREEHREATVQQALHAFQEQQNRKRAVVPFVASFLGAAAALAIAAVVFLFNGDKVQLEEGEAISREMIVQAYLELRQTFPEGLDAVAFVDGEMQIYPGLAGAAEAPPSYVEMTLGSTVVKVVAAQGASLPIVVNGSTVTIEFMDDASGQPAVLGEDFYWSAQAEFMPTNRAVQKAEQLNLFL
jgi:hypothetical protein